MADVTVTAANVSERSSTVTDRVQVGEAVTAGTILYQKASDEKYYLADANVDAETSGTKSVVFCLGNTQAADEYVTVAKDGDVDVGGTVAAGVTYHLSATGGGVWGDTVPASGSFATRVGIGKSTTEIELDLKASGYQVV